MTGYRCLNPEWFSILFLAHHCAYQFLANGARPYLPYLSMITAASHIIRLAMLGFNIWHWCYTVLASREMQHPSANHLSLSLLANGAHIIILNNILWSLPYAYHQTLQPRHSISMTYKVTMPLNMANFITISTPFNRNSKHSPSCRHVSQFKRIGHSTNIPIRPIY